MGRDRLSGGEGGDIFVIKKDPGAVDVITDFNAADGDKIDLSDFADVFRTDFDLRSEFVNDGTVLHLGDGQAIYFEGLFDIAPYTGEKFPVFFGTGGFFDDGFDKVIGIPNANPPLFGGEFPSVTPGDDARINAGKGAGDGAGAGSENAGVGAGFNRRIH